ncbi:MAG: DUF4430 domain-containing protein [Clostridia bacterium]|nr:DUF4430 domain-containing protein [Clostridia bacterium]MDD4146511.1 DUF4430 domain-containing protein [Clostridia bacterium]MDD4665262.1 DUF4430 domain-containing protein [Clostridia bacterium]
MRKKGLLLLILSVFLLIFPACTKQSSDPPVSTGEKETAVSSVTKETTKAAESSQADSEKIKDLEGLNKGQKESLPTKKTEGKKTFSLRVSQNYGAGTLAKEEVLLKPKMSVMDGLDRVCADQVETAYGGSYVKGIGNLRSEAGGIGKPKQDWFFFVNGIFADQGALDYFPQPGEKVWWDYHPWQMFQATTAVIGCYPEPFLHGYRGKTKATVILYCPEEKELALQLDSALKAVGVPKVTLAEITNELLAEREGPTLVVGKWQELQENVYLADLNQAFQKNGTFVHFTENSLELLDYTGKTARELTAGVGIISASGESAGDDSPLWLISGLDNEGLQNAVKLLVEWPAQISGFFSAAVLAAEVIRLPVMP